MIEFEGDAHNPRPAPRLWIGSSEEELEADPSATTVVGRMGDLLVGKDDPHMHRHLLHFNFTRGLWRIKNVGRFIPVHITTEDDHLITTLSPGSTCAVEWPEFLLRFVAGSNHYVLDCQAEIASLADPTAFSLHGDDTVGIGPLPEDVRLVLAAIAQEILESGTQDYSLMLKNQDVADQLGWTKKTFDHKLDGICKYFASFGVGNTVGAKDLAASNRRIKVIQHAIEAKLIIRADLKLVRQAQQQAGNA